MPLRLSGSCHCRAVRFSLDSHTPHPYQLCYCSICRKTAGGGGFSINIMGLARTLHVEGKDALAVYRAEIPHGSGTAPSEGRRHACRHCATALWLFDARWAELVHPLAAAIDTPLPRPPSRVHIMLSSKADWVVPDIGPNDERFDQYPTESIEAWHQARGLWID